MDILRSKIGHLWILQFIFVIFVKFKKGLAISQQVDSQSPRRVCYDIIGCFEPFVTNPDVPLPMSPEEVDATFILHTNPQPTVAEILNGTQDSLRSSSFDPTKKTKFIIHGFALLQHEISKWVPETTQTILAKEDVNVIIVDWVDGARVEYEQATQNTRVVGALTAHLMRTIMDTYGYDPMKFHIIGFSLGAHVAGFSGKELIKLNEQHKIGRITGLDPANPGFNYDNSTVRLDKTDAHFVDVIHTDISTLLVVASGLNRNLGHADFYPNGGNDQPGCNTWKSDSSLVSAVTDVTVCDHTRAPKLFINSINMTDENHFTAYKCPSYAKFKEGKCLRCRGKRATKKGKSRCTTMGYWAEPPKAKKQLQYYLQTSDKEPFCAKHYQVQIHWRKGKGSSADGLRGSLYIKLHGERGSTKEFALNDGATFHIVPGKTSRFLVSHACNDDIGDILRVTFRWKRPTCWTYFFCSQEEIYLKRIKLIDAAKQKRYVFLSLEMDRDNDGRKDVIAVPSDVEEELLKKSYIRRNHADKFVPLIVPELAPVEDGVNAQVMPRESSQKEEKRDDFSEIEQYYNSNSDSAS